MAKLTVFDRHQERIAAQSLRLHDAMVAVAGGPSKEEARRILRGLGWTEERIATAERKE